MLHQAPRLLFRGQPQTGGDGPLVPRQPLFHHLAVADDALSDGASAHGLAGGLAVDAIPLVGHHRHDAVGRKEAILPRALPDHILPQQTAIRELVQGLQGGGEHRLVADKNAAGVAQQDLFGVVAPQGRPQSPVFPDLPSDAQNVIDRGGPVRILFHRSLINSW